MKRYGMKAGRGMGRRLAVAAAAVETLESRRLLAVTLLTDLNAQQVAPSGQSGAALVGSVAFLAQDDAAHGAELWRTDGTAAGTYLLKDVRPGGVGSSPTWLTRVGGTLFFTADDGTHGAELWESDGTAAGTVLVKDIAPGTAASNPANLIDVNGTLFFTANDGTHGYELWKSDGTTAGTVLVKDIWSGVGSAFPSTATSTPPLMANLNGTLIFPANEGFKGTELWKSDGTAAGTVLVQDLTAGSAGSTFGAMTVANGAVYFPVTTPTYGSELWKTDGTAAGTAIVKDLYPGTSGSSPQVLAVSGGLVYFKAAAGGNTLLWRTDGTDAGTKSFGYSPNAAVDVNNTVFFASGYSLYKTDGTTVATIRSGFQSIGSLWSVNGALYFAGDDGSGSGVELWRSDGTAGGTAMVKDLNPGTASSQPQNVLPLGVTGRFVFTATDPSLGGAYYASDGTTAGTTLLADLNPRTADATPLWLKAFNGAIYFAATGPVSGRELYRTDGTGAGTTLAVDVYPGPWSGDPFQLTTWNGHLVFAANDGYHGEEVTLSDGTAAGTAMLADIDAGSNPSNPGNFFTGGPYLYFTASDSSSYTSGVQLWRTDGTAAGTVRLTNPQYPVGANTSNSYNMADLNGTLLFSMSNPDQGLWKTDGTLAGTVAVRSEFQRVANMINVGGTVYFTAYNSSLGYQSIWKTDGTAAGTVAAFPSLVLSTTVGAPFSLTECGGALYFMQGNYNNGMNLYRGDLTTGAYTLVKSWKALSAVTANPTLVNANGVLYLAVEDGTHGQELWRSDGTAAGTTQVSDIVPGATGAAIRNLQAVDGYLYFSADDGAVTGAHGRELWRSDGTAAGTVMLADVRPGEDDTGSGPSAVTALGNNVYFSEDDGLHGVELFRADGPTFATLGGDGTLTITGTANNDVVHLSGNGSLVQVNLNGLLATFNAGAVASIVVNGTAGEDEVDVDSSLAAPLQFAGASSYTLDANAGKVTLGGNALPAGSNVAVGAGAAVVFAGSESLGSLTVAGGTASIPSGLGATLTVAGLFSITGSGTLDLGNNALLVPSTPDVAAYVARAAGAAQPSGLNAWTGSGLTSSLVKADAANGNAKQLTLGYFDSRDNAQTGLSVPAGQTLVKLTVYGDATGDGKVSIADLSVWNNNFGVTSPRWSQGDFNYDGKVNIADLSVWNNDFGNAAPPAVTAAAAVSPTVAPAQTSASGSQAVANRPAAAAVAGSDAQPVRRPRWLAPWRRVARQREQQARERHSSQNEAAVSVPPHDGQHGKRGRR